MIKSDAITVSTSSSNMSDDNTENQNKEFCNPQVELSGDQLCRSILSVHSNKDQNLNDQGQGEDCQNESEESDYKEKCGSSNNETANKKNANDCNEKDSSKEKENDSSMGNQDSIHTFFISSEQQYRDISNGQNFEISQDVSRVLGTSFLSRSISGLSNILNSPQSEIVDTNIESHSFDSKNETKEYRGRGVPNKAYTSSKDKINQNALGGSPSNSKFTTDETQIKYLNESLVSFPVSVQSESQLMFPYEKLNSELQLSQNKVETSFVVSDDGDETSNDQNECDTISDSLYSSNKTISKASTDSEFLSPMTPLTAMRRNSVQLALDESKAYLKRIKELSIALEKSRSETKIETKRRLEYEAIIENLTSSTPTSEISRHNKTNTSAVVSPISKLPCLEDVSTHSSSLMEAGAVRHDDSLRKQAQLEDHIHCDLVKENEALQQTVNRLKDNLSKMKENSNALDEKIRNAQAYGINMEASRDLIQSRLQEQKKKFENEVLESNKNLESAQNQIRIWQHELESCRNEKNNLEVKLKTSTDKIKVLSTELEQIKIKKNQTEYDKSMNGETNQNKDEQYREMRRNLDTCQRELDAERVHIQDLLKERSHMREQLIVMKESHSSDNYKLEQNKDHDYETKLRMIKEDRDSCAIRAEEWETKAVILQEKLDRSTPREKVLELKAALDISRKQIFVLQRKLDNSSQRSEKGKKSVCSDHDVDEVSHETVPQANFNMLRIRFQRLAEDYEECKKKEAKTRNQLAQTNHQIQNALCDIAAEKRIVEESFDAIEESNMENSNMAKRYDISAQDKNEDSSNNMEKIKKMLENIADQINAFLLFQHKISNSTSDQSNAEYSFWSINPEETDCAINRPIDFFRDEHNSSNNNLNDSDNVLEATFSRANSTFQFDDTRLVVLLEEARNSVHRNMIIDDSISDSSTFVHYSTGKISRLREELRKSDISREDIEKDFESLLLMLDDTNVKVEHCKEYINYLEETHLTQQKLQLQEHSMYKNKLQLIENKNIELLDDIEISKKAHVNEKERLLLEINKLKLLVNSNELEIEKLGEKLQYLEEESNQLQQTRSKLIQLENEKHQLQNKVSSLEDAIEKLQTDNNCIDKMNEKLIKAEELARKLEDEVDILSNNLEVKSLKLLETERRSEEIGEIASDLKDQNTHLEMKNEELDEMLMNTRKKMSNLEESINTVKESLSKVEKEKESKTEYSNKLEAENSSIAANLKNSEETIDRMQAEIQILKNQLSDEMLKSVEVEKQKEVIRNEYNEKEANWKHVMKEKEALFLEIQHLSNNEQSLIKETCMEKITKLEEEMNEMTERNALLDSELNAAKVNATNEACKANELVKDTQREYEQLEIQLEENKKKYFFLETDYAKQQKIASNDSNTLQNEIKELKIKVQSIESEKTQFESTIQKFKKRERILEDKLSHLTHCLDLCNAECNKAKKILKKSEQAKAVFEHELKSSLGDFDRLKANHEKKMERMNSLVVEITQTKDEFAATIENKDEYIAEMENQLNSISTKL